MNLEQGLQRLFSVVDKNLRHPHYKRVTEKADLYMALVTGEGLDNYLQQFVRRESEALFEQRKQITSHITPCILKNILDVYRKVPRARYSKIVAHQGKAGSKSDAMTADLNSVMSGFWGDKGLEKWFQSRLLELNAVDPNAFVVIEFEGTDGKKLAQPYPYEVSAANAIDYLYTNRVLQYLIAAHQMEIEDGGQKGKRSRYTLYLENETAILDPMPVIGTQLGEPGVIILIDGAPAVWLGGKPYRIVTPTPHNIGQVNAFRVGYVRDLYTNGATCVAPYEAAVPLLLKTLKLNSEHDLAATLTAHPYQIRYADSCDDCMKGARPDGSTCTTCHGTGRKTITSGQEELVLDMPTHKDDLLDLSKLLIFVTPPIDVLTFQESAIDRISAAAVKTVFNTDVFSRQEIAETATGKNISLQNVYDTLFDFAEDFSAKWVFSVKIIARIIDREEGLVAVMKFPRDFKMKDLSELFQDLKAANDSGAGPEVVRAIQQQIVSTVMVDDPLELQRYAVRERLNPFTGLTKEEILVAISSELTPRESKVLYLNMGSIFDTLEEQHGHGFYSMDQRRQRELVAAEVAKIIAEISGAAEEPVLNLN